MRLRTLLPGQTCQIWTAEPSGGEPVRQFETALCRLESPNWLSSGDALVLNGEGLLWRLSLAPTRQLEKIEVTGVPQLNNDHVLDPDGEHIYLSAYDRQIYRAPVSGGAAELVTTDSSVGVQHFLHGVHPRGDRLAFIGLRPAPGDGRTLADVFTMSVDGGDYRKLTSGPGHSDGCEYSPDGEWVYFNTELFDGHAQIARIRPDGSGLERLTFDDHVNWFPHISPDGRWATYLAFSPGTEGHPSNVWVDVKVVALDDWSSATTAARLFGGQGTLNTPSWAPDSSAFAYVSYPTDPAE
ncbi:TolB family protein [Plantactinospora endophytica]|uniref:TolB family protein n=1 Tax=Plantactinospora endophytica TaxID=673535 RepID=UPI001940F766|nr:PD40 domain-containing protein [Plantactinospora endophytica]